MATFVGAEYIVANLLIAKKNHDEDSSMSLEELGNASVYIQRRSLNTDVDAIFSSSMEQLSAAVFEFCDYFKYNEAQQKISVVESKEISDLKSRFIGYLPFDVLSFLVKAANDAVQQQQHAIPT